MDKQHHLVEYYFEASAFSWEIAPGKYMAAWGFNMQVPGPLIKARKGDTLILKFKNNLPQPTVIHWHGIRLPSSMDGTAEVQKLVEPGKEFEYRFQLEDAGTFWYHSHHNETVQVAKGMYGAIVVEDENDPVADEDKVFVIGDIKPSDVLKLTESSLSSPTPIIKEEELSHDMLLINGKLVPNISMHAGQVERWRFINSTNAGCFKLTTGRKAFHIIGSDGGLIEKPVKVTGELITPGERLEILAGPFEEGETGNVTASTNLGSTTTKPSIQTLATLSILAAKPSVAVIPETMRLIEPLCTRDAPVNRHVKLSVAESTGNGLKFMINDDVHINDQPVTVGELQVWEINNVSGMDHPFHLHGFFFQVLEINGKAPPYTAWKDTINLPPQTKIKIAWLPDNRPGIWMYHCHILSHHAAGMMANFEVIEGSKPYVPLLSAHHHH